MKKKIFIIILFLRCVFIGNVCVCGVHLWKIELIGHSLETSQKDDRLNNQVFMVEWLNGSSSELKAYDSSL